MKDYPIDPWRSARQQKRWDEQVRENNPNKHRVEAGACHALSTVFRWHEENDPRITPLLEHLGDWYYQTFGTDYQCEAWSPGIPGALWWGVLRGQVRLKNRVCGAWAGEPHDPCQEPPVHFYCSEDPHAYEQDWRCALHPLHDPEDTEEDVSGEGNPWVYRVVLNGQKAKDVFPKRTTFPLDFEDSSKYLVVEHRIVDKQVRHFAWREGDSMSIRSGPYMASVIEEVLSPVEQP